MGSFADDKEVQRVKNALYLELPASIVDDAFARLDKQSTAIELQAKADENDYHWHHQKHIEKLAHDGSVSGYFLDRRDVYTAQRAKLLS